MLIGSRVQLSELPDNTVVQASDTYFQLTDNVKNLDMYIDKHITELCKMSFGILMYINRIKDLFSSETRTVVVLTLVLISISYGMAVWGTTNKTVIESKKKNFAAKAAVGGRR